MKLFHFFLFLFLLLLWFAWRREIKKKGTRVIFEKTTKLYVGAVAFLAALDALVVDVNTTCLSFLPSILCSLFLVIGDDLSEILSLECSSHLLF